MIEIILQNAANVIFQNVAPVSKSGGAVQTIVRRDGNRAYNVPAVPASSDGSNQGNDYIDMLPADSQSAIAFWQVVTASVDDKLGPATNQHIPMKARARLVVWANKRRLSPPNVQAVLGECITQVLNSTELGETYIQGINPTLIAVEKRDRTIFNEYNLDEAETQYLTEPYDFASAIFDIQYTIMLTCLPEVSAVEPSL